MKKLVFTFLFLFAICVPAFALLVTDSTDEENFQYLVAYKFATEDLAANVSNVNIPIIPRKAGVNFFYVLPKGGKVVGISVAGNMGLLPTEAATFDVTINGQTTGVQTVLEKVARSAVGNVGSSGENYAYMRQYRNETKVAKGFRRGFHDDYNFYNEEQPYGRATPLSAGNRIGVQVTTSSAGHADNDVVAVVYVLE